MKNFIIILMLIIAIGCGGSSSDPIQPSEDNPHYNPPTEYPYNALPCTRDYADTGCGMCHH